MIKTSMTKMAKAESTARNMDSLNVEFMRSLVKQYSELGQWTSALFWADAAAATGSASGEASGDDIWLLASAMLARGEWHRAAYAVTSRGLHKKHLLCLGVAMRAHLAAKEPTEALNLCDECDPNVLEPRPGDRTHSRALAGVLVSQGRALAALERREAAAEALTAAMHSDCACYEALHLLLEHQALQTSQEKELVDTLPYNSQLSPIEGAFLKAAYRQRLRPYSSEPIPDPLPNDTTTVEVSRINSRTAEAAINKARRLTASCEWASALKLLDSVDPWCAPEIRTACLVELKKSSELFAFAHTLVDAYPNSWTAWYAVGCYYYLIGKNEFARRYLSKAKSLDAGAGCVWLAYGHSFAADNEHDQAMAAYFKASQLMSGCHLPFLYVAVECSLLNNMSMCERFLLKAANVHNGDESAIEPSELSSNTWEQLAATVKEPHIAHEAAVCAFAHGNYTLAITLLKQAIKHAGDEDNLNPRWASSLDAMGHCYRMLSQPQRAATWHRRALALRPSPATPRAALALCAAVAGDNQEAAELLHSVLAKEPDDVVCAALLDSVVDSMHSNFDDEEIPQLAFPPVNISLPTGGSPTQAVAINHDATNNSDMSMSFETSLDFD